MQKYYSVRLVVVCAALVSLVGCNPSANPPANQPPPSPATASSDGGSAHAHGAGPHGGAVADWGGGKYHVEFTVDHDQKQATVYVLGGDEKTPAPISADQLVLSIEQPAFQVELKPSPLEGENEGASRFVGTHESLGVVQEFSGTIIGEVEGTPYAGEFAEEPHAQHESK